MDQSYVNPNLLQAFQVGIGIGFVVLTTLILFPGREQKVSGTTEETRTKEKPGLRMRAPEGYGYWTPHRQLNNAVYVILIVGTIVLLLQSYDHSPSPLLGAIFRVYCPRESAVLSGNEQT